MPYIPHVHWYNYVPESTVPTSGSCKRQTAQKLGSCSSSDTQLFSLQANHWLDRLSWLRLLFGYSALTCSLQANNCPPRAVPGPLGLFLIRVEPTHVPLFLCLGYLIASTLHLSRCTLLLQVTCNIRPWDIHTACCSGRKSVFVIWAFVILSCNVNCVVELICDKFMWPGHNLHKI